MSIYQNRIDLYTTKITQLDDDITNIAAGMTGPTGVTGPSELLTYLNKVKGYIQDESDKLTGRRDDLTSRQNNLDIGFTGAHQTLVDEINTTFNQEYSNIIDQNLKEQNDTQKSDFFNLYQSCPSDFLKECFIRSYFDYGQPKTPHPSGPTGPPGPPGPTGA